MHFEHIYIRKVKICGRVTFLWHFEKCVSNIYIYEKWTFCEKEDFCWPPQNAFPTYIYTKNERFVKSDTFFWPKKCISHIYIYEKWTFGSSNVAFSVTQSHLLRIHRGCSRNSGASRRNKRKQWFCILRMPFSCFSCC